MARCSLNLERERERIERKPHVVVGGLADTSSKAKGVLEGPSKTRQQLLPTHGQGMGLASIPMPCLPVPGALLPSLCCVLSLWHIPLGLGAQLVPSFLLAPGLPPTLAESAWPSTHSPHP
jgi:hypothetical protein